jgi:glycosyltransferase involved in cell wall biosynthesis
MGQGRPLLAALCRPSGCAPETLLRHNSIYITMIDTLPSSLESVTPMNTSPAEPVTLSVIVASYNRASFLPSCIASLREAGVPGMEIVIVDDGSKDNTRAVVESLGAGIRYLYHENRGLSAARNTGILAATGKYIAYLDSDDFWLPGVAEKLVAFLDRHPEIGAVFTEARVGNPQDGYTSWIRAAGQQAFQELPSTEIEPGFRLLETLPFYRGMLSRNAIFTGAIIQRRELVIEAGLFDPQLKATGDWELWLRMLHQGKFAFCPETLAIYTRHAENMTNDEDRMRQAFCDTLRVHAGRALPIREEEKALLRKARKACAFSYAYSAYERNQYPIARRRFAQAIHETGFELRTALYWAISALPGPLPRFVRQMKWRMAGAASS